MTLSSQPVESLMPPPESTDIVLDAWHLALGDALAQERASWQRERALIEAQAAQSVAELRARVMELERKLEAMMQQKMLDVTAMIEARLAQLRDGRDGVGVIGPVGERGEMGLQGLPGPQGPPGETGHGIEGKQGQEGKVGPQGEKGIGVKGDRGEAGPQGEDGTDGTDGADGEDGADGLSIIGPAGPPGADGPRGASGERGERGERGSTGAAGPQGGVGSAGPAGLPGERGERGFTGEAGPQGGVGGAGPAGLPGERGERGIDGVPGKLPRVKLWQPDVVFYDGNVVRHERGTYQALKDTSQRPGSGEDWICIAAGGLDARTPQVRGTYDPDASYKALDVVASNGGSFIARKDGPGPCPGEGWQLIARQGQRGIAGEKGERGERGLPGEPGKPLVLKGWTIDRENFVAIPLLSDGSRGPTLELRGLFEQFQKDVDG